MIAASDLQPLLITDDLDEVVDHLDRYAVRQFGMVSRTRSSSRSDSDQVAAVLAGFFARPRIYP